MSGIPREHRVPIGDLEFAELVERQDLLPQMAYGDGPHPRLWVAIPGLTPGFKTRSGTTVSAAEFLRLLHSVRTMRGDEALRLVVDTRDSRRIGVAFTEAGRRDRDDWRRWAELVRKGRKRSRRTRRRNSIRARV